MAACFRARSTRLRPGSATSSAIKTIDHHGQPWRSLVPETADGNYRVPVAQSVSQRDKEALEIATKTVLPLGVLLPLLIALIYFGSARTEATR